jgi:hypothetical protein
LYLFIKGSATKPQRPMKIWKTRIRRAYCHPASYPISSMTNIVVKGTDKTEGTNINIRSYWKISELIRMNSLPEFVSVRLFKLRTPSLSKIDETSTFFIFTAIMNPLIRD